MYAPRAFHRAATIVALLTTALASACSSSGSGWTVTNETDAMTDVSMSEAVATIEGDNFNLETTVVCTGSGKLGYQFRTFDKSGEPADLKTDNIHGSFGRITVVRIDDEKPYELWDFGRFTNQVMMTGRSATDMAVGSKLVLRLRFANGNETYTLDQTDPQLRSVFKGCMPAKASPAASVTAPAAAPSDEGGETALLVEPNGSSAGERTTEGTGEKATCWTPPSGPNVVDDAERGLSFQEVQEIEGVTGRPYQQGDSVYGRAEDRCPA